MTISLGLVSSLWPQSKFIRPGDFKDRPGRRIEASVNIRCISPTIRSTTTTPRPVRVPWILDSAQRGPEKALCQRKASLGIANRKRQPRTLREAAQEIGISALEGLSVLNGIFDS